ncbi:branched-chain amino acid ABC transporter permease [Acuticoccus sediminis]|uniref:Branched-chain amino acid ABC transporter permease n=1 Tax=Acuticoccus sediminis TaxID=2184697 RepID=A0A8B2P0B9_9HYPH|nr:branched-chain amino acid ABC transporter permease [Acuticoccus sediminis]RAI02250.1 branched-chain amino acid ABC transporter permease [Acuticoccus sediminis]
MDAYLVAILTVAGIYVILALALNLQYGFTGLINFGIVGFYGLGAYASGIATETLGLPFVLGLVMALAVGALSGAAVALLSLRLSGDFLAIVTLGFAETVRLALNNEDWLTRGPRGFIIMTRPVFDGLGRSATSWFILGVVALVALVVLLVMVRLARSAYGRVLRAIREDDLVPATLGKDVFVYRLQAFVIGAMITAAGGSLYAHYTQTITPENFTTPIAILVWMSVVVGGAGNNLGVVLGALVVTAIYEGTRFLAPWLGFLDAEQISALRFVVIGSALIIVIRYRPEGLLPEPRHRPVVPAPSAPAR